MLNNARVTDLHTTMSGYIIPPRRIDVCQIVGEEFEKLRERLWEGARPSSLREIEIGITGQQHEVDDLEDATLNWDWRKSRL